MSENVVDLEEARKKRLLEEIRRAIAEAKAHPIPEIDCRGRKPQLCLAAYQWDDHAEVSIHFIESSDGVPDDFGVIKMSFEQWKEFRNEIDRIINFCEKQVEK